MTHIEQLIKDMCPEGVEFKKLGEVADILNGYAFKSELYSSDGIRIIRISDVQKGSFSNKDVKYYPLELQNEFRSFILKEEDIAVSLTGNCGRVAYVTKEILPAALNQRVACLRIKEKVLSRYLFHVLNRSQFECEAMSNANGGGQKNLSTIWLAGYTIPLPPIEIQKKIVECLDKFSALAAELQAELQKRRTQYEFYRTRLLTPPPTESNSADKFDDRNWEWKTFAELGAFYGGLSGKTKEDFKDGNAKYITYLNIGCNPALRFDILETVKVGPNERQNTIQYGDALFTGSSETPDECAMSSVVTEQPTENIYLNSFCFGFRFNSLDGICPAFYKHYFRCDAFRKAVRRTANGTTRFNVSKKEFAKLSIPIPPIAEQKRIADILDKFEKLISSMEEGIPAEQAAQQKRYEYYRDKLLTFEKRP